MTTTQPGRHRVLLVLLTALLLGAARRAEAVSVEDIIGLTRAGLGDEVLVALVETDGTVFSLTPAQLVQLKDAGVSERVIVAMLWQGRAPIPETPTASDAALLPEQVQPELRLDLSRPAEPSQPAIVIAPTVIPWPIFVQTPRRPIPGAQHRFDFTPPPEGFGRFSNTFGRFLNDGFPRPLTAASAPPVR